MYLQTTKDLRVGRFLFFSGKKDPTLQTEKQSVMSIPLHNSLPSFLSFFEFVYIYI